MKICTALRREYDLPKKVSQNTIVSNIFKICTALRRERDFRLLRLKNRQELFFSPPWGRRVYFFRLRWPPRDDLGTLSVVALAARALREASGRENGTFGDRFWIIFAYFSPFCGLPRLAFFLRARDLTLGLFLRAPLLLTRFSRQRRERTVYRKTQGILQVPTFAAAPARSEKRPNDQPTTRPKTDRSESKKHGKSSYFASPNVFGRGSFEHTSRKPLRDPPGGPAGPPGRRLSINFSPPGVPS